VRSRYDNSVSGDNRNRGGIGLPVGFLGRLQKKKEGTKRKGGKTNRDLAPGFRLGGKCQEAQSAKTNPTTLSTTSISSFASVSVGRKVNVAMAGRGERGMFLTTPKII